MKQRRKELEIFSLSFLDIISCGFGAVVLQVLISPFAESVLPGGADKASQLLQQVIGAEGRVSELEGALDRESESEAELRARLARQAAQVAAAEQALAAATAKSREAQQNVEGLQAVQRSLENRQRASISTGTSDTRDEEVGGIPVDSDFVIFIIDTSGSMQSIWERVTREVENVINIHPRIKGFQVLNDNGLHLISGYSGRWIPDTAKTRANVIRLFRTWKSASNSSPVEGLEVALKRYVKPTEKVSIYIFGDDYTGSSYDPVIQTLNRLNTNRVTQKPQARVHAIGFLSLQTRGRFEILMREVTRQNNGTFVALPP